MKRVFISLKGNGEEKLVGSSCFFSRPTKTSSPKLGRK